MHLFGQSAFMQALGWATLNSFWQIGLLWCLYAVLVPVLKLSSSQKYIFALSALVSGLCLFLLCLCFRWEHSVPYTFYNTAQILPTSALDEIIRSASVVYLLLLFFPLYNLYRNLAYLQTVKTRYLSKAHYSYRLFVNKVAQQLGIKKTVHVYISEFIKSPVTIGYLKPIILLPVAGLNNLTMQQAEAILLHELSHIKRADYLINLMVMVVHTLLYFNPFVRLFVKVIEAEREACCDQTVLQFQYDRISYAAALLVLEQHSQSFLIAASGKNNLLLRIKNIIGIETKPVVKISQVLAIFSALVFIIGINIFLITGNHTASQKETSYARIINPFYIFRAPGPDENTKGNQKTAQPVKPSIADATTLAATVPDTYGPKAQLSPIKEELFQDTEEQPDSVILLNVNFNLADANLSKDQKDKVKSTVKATKEILSKLEWKELEKTIADGMTNKEKEVAKKQYLFQVQQINWQELEAKLKTNYHTIDWDKLSARINGASTFIKLDSLQDAYRNILVQVNKSVFDSSGSCKILPIPVISKENLLEIKGEAQKRLNIITSIRNKKIIRL